MPRTRERGGLARAAVALRMEEAGAAILEFALVLPILVLLVFGCFEIGRALLVRQAMDGAVRAGARSLARVPDPACRPGCPPAVARAVALTLEQILANAGVRREAVSVRPQNDDGAGTVGMAATVAFDVGLLDPAVFRSRWLLTAHHQERYVGE